MTWAALTLAGPILAFAVLGLVPPWRRAGRPAAYLSILGVTVSLVSSVGLLFEYWGHPEPRSWEFLWVPLRHAPTIRFGLLVDGLSVAMLPVVSLVAWIVQVYSLGYMKEEGRSSLGRYYTYHSLFAFSMMGLVLAHNLLQTYVFWELVGLCSYLLIGFWFEKPEAARAAVKAFWITRLGDVGFAIGTVFLWAAGGTFVFADLFQRADSGALAGTFLSLGVLGLFIGAMGKSAQFPLHIWLPDAMEGPTPVSALIHAATMVVAGVYLTIRILPLLQHAPEVSRWILSLGAFTALLAASMALVERDVKRILAFSTISQLGAMMAAAGAGAAIASFYHLLTHAYFKALLFLAAGSLIHAVHTNDIFKMGRLWKKMPLTGIYFLVGALSLAGVFPTSGFFSKEEILAELWQKGHPVAFWTLVLTAFMTAFYVFRAFFLVFFGPREAEGHPHESPALMTAPMGVLAVLALVAGSFGPGIGALLHHSISLGTESSGTLTAPDFLPVLGTAVAFLGILAAWMGYHTQRFSPSRIHAASGPLGRLLERGYFIDAFFLLLYRWLFLGLSSLVGWVDRYVVDGLVNLLTWLTYRLTEGLRRVQNGKVQDALYAVVLGFLLLVLVAMRL